MQYVWQHRLWPHQEMRTVDGVPVFVIDPGQLNTNSGPDFFNAKIRIGQRIWAGDVEIHVRASDWHRHHHDGDKAYDSVILHVVDRDDTMIRRSNGEVIPQMCMPCSPSLNTDYRSLVERADRDLPCASTIANTPKIYLTDWLSALTYERMHTKSDHITELAALSAGDAEEACYVTIARTLGFGVNSEPFERLARSLPLRTIFKHRDSLLSIEALLFGQSGLLSEVAMAPRSSYPGSLVNEYRFLAQKFSLRPLASPGWKMGRIRPQNFPHRRIAFLAQLIHDEPNFRSKILGFKDIEEARAFFDRPLTGFWADHYHFSSSPSDRVPGRMSRASIDLLIINTVAPIKFNYGITHGDNKCIQEAIDLLESLPPERNSIVELFGRVGIKADSAAMSQALVHLRKKYCMERKCLYCRLGHKHLSSCAKR